MIESLSRTEPTPKLTTQARLAIGLELFLGIGALVGGGALLLAPDGGLLGMPLSVLGRSPFHSFLWPGVLLFSFLGVGPSIVAVLTLKRSPLAPLAAIAVGGALVVWIAVEMVMLAGPGSLAWALYLVLGTSLAALGLTWPRATGEICALAQLVQGRCKSCSIQSAHPLD